MNRQNPKQESIEVSPKLVERFLDNQAKQLKIEEQRLNIDRDNNNHNFQLASKSIDAQAKDLENQRSHKKQIYYLVSIVGLIVFAGILGMIFFCLHIGKEQVALEIIKLGGTSIISVFGGYFYGRSRGKKDSENIDP